MSWLPPLSVERMLPFAVNKDTHILAIYLLKAAQSFSFFFSLS